MNAYELADILHQSDFLAMDFAEDAATMLRQQADTIYNHMELITELRKECNARADRIAELEKVSSKPVAEVIEWEETYGHTFKKRTVSTVKWLENVEVGTKLYTHPVKQLSDEDISKIAIKFNLGEQYGGADNVSVSYVLGSYWHGEHIDSTNELLDFARAIIKEITE